MKKPQLLLFDVNETLLDLSEMKTEINQSFAHDFAFNQWFATMLHYSLVGNEADLYQPFGEVGKATLRMTALTNSAPQAVKQQMEFAGLTPFFEALLSVDEVGKYLFEYYDDIGKYKAQPSYQ